MVLSWLMFEALICPCIIKSSKDRGQPCLKPLCSDTCDERNPLFIIMDVFCLRSYLRKFINSGKNPIFLLFYIERFYLFHRRPSLGLFVVAINNCFFCFVYVIISLVRNRLSNIVLFGMEQFYSFDIISGIIYFNLLAKIFVSIL